MHTGDALPASPAAVQAASYKSAAGTASFTITHNLNNIGALAQVRDTATGERRYPKIVNTDANTITVSGYLTAPTNNQYTVDIVG